MLTAQSFTTHGLHFNFTAFVCPETRKVWVSGNDFARSLGYVLYADAVYYHVTDKRKNKMKFFKLLSGNATVHRLPRLWQRTTVMINARGMHDLILASAYVRDANSLVSCFEQTILPTIARTGRYIEILETAQ